MLFRRSTNSSSPTPTQRQQAATTPPPAIKAQATTPASVGEDMAVIENVLQHARSLRPLSTDHFLEELYQRLGAATAIEKPGKPLCIPLYETDLWQIQYACEEIERRGGPDTHDLAAQARALLRRLHFNLGRAIAVQELGGLPVYAHMLPAPSRDA